MALMEDSYFDLEEYLAALLGKRLGRLLNRYMTTGNGTNQPTGIQWPRSLAAYHPGASGEVTSLIYDDLVNTMELVDEAYQHLPRPGGCLRPQRENCQEAQRHSWSSHLDGRLDRRVRTSLSGDNLRRPCQRQ